MDETERNSSESVESQEHFERVKHLSNRNARFGFKSSPDPQRHTSTTESDIVTLSPVHFKRESTLKEGRRKKTAGSIRLKKKSCKTPSRKTDPETCSVSEASF